MRLEVHSAADFLMNLLRLKHSSSLPEYQLQHFKGSLQSLLALRFRSHWYPDVPTKGSGYRCIRINGKMDPLVEQAGHAVGLPALTLRKMLPTELTLWIDPEEVSYRIGENGSICVLYDSQSRASPSSDLDSTGSGAMSEEFIMDRVGKLDMSDIQLMDLLETNNKPTVTPPTTATTTPNTKLPATKPRNKSNLGLDDHHNNHQVQHHHQQQHLQQQQQQQQHHHQMSPPLSPPYHRNSRHHLNSNINNSPHHMQNQQQQHSINFNFMDQAHLYHWDGFSNNNNNNNMNKVSTRFFLHIYIFINNICFCLFFLILFN